MSPSLPAVRQSLEETADCKKSGGYHSSLKKTYLKSTIGQPHKTCNRIEEATFLVLAKTYEEPIPKIVVKNKSPSVEYKSSSHQKMATGMWTNAQIKLLTRFAFHSSPKTFHSLLK